MKDTGLLIVYTKDDKMLAKLLNKSKVGEIDNDAQSVIKSRFMQNE